MREEFEEWASRYHGTARMGVVGLIYSNEAVQHDWNVWQASRQAIVVKLPKRPDETWGSMPYERGQLDGMNLMIDECQDALDTAGVRYE